MPTVQKFLQKKTIYGPKKDPVWVYLEKEMRENIEKKPYNEKVGDWLKFLKDLKYYFYCEARGMSRGMTQSLCSISGPPKSWNQLRGGHGPHDPPPGSAVDNGWVLKDGKYQFKWFEGDQLPNYVSDSLKTQSAKRKLRRLQAEVGPAWYLELSSCQREALANLKYNIHQDIIEDDPNRTRQSLSGLGITLKVPKTILMQAMIDSVEDPGVFIWNLYKAIYKTYPSDLRGQYDMNAMILMSSLVFIDLEECIQRLNKLTETKKKPPPPPIKKPKKNFQPDCRYGEYLQQCYVPFYSNHPDPGKKKPKPTLAYKFRLRSEESYERIIKDKNFLEKRKERNKKEKQSERICNYKFWEPPSTLRNTDPKMAAYVNKLRMIKKKAKPKHKAPYKNVQYQVGGVSFTGGTPHYVLNNIGLLPTGFAPINGGTVVFNGEYITLILGFWKTAKEQKARCDHACDCLTKWDSTVMDYLKESKCKCGHLYDFYNEGKSKEKYFHPATRHGPFWLDRAKVYQTDPMEDFIRDTVREAMMSAAPTPYPSTPTISPSGLSEKELLSAFLADLSDTPLILPHLPQANLLNNLQEWVRKRVKDKVSPRQHKRWLLQSQRRWLDLKHIDFRARAYRIPFTLKQLEHMKWSHRKLVQKLFEILLDDFVLRNRLKQVEQTRLWWSTTKYDAYPSKAFLDIFFTYMPGRMKDTFLINPYSSELTPKSGAKTCPL